MADVKDDDEARLIARGRAVTDGMKHIALARLFEAWRRAPQQRLGQLIVNALPANYRGDPFHAEDFDLVGFVEKMVGIEPPNDDDEPWSKVGR